MQHEAESTTADPEQACCNSAVGATANKESSPSDVLERDADLTDLSNYVSSGDVVLNLGSHHAKPDRLVGPSGRVISIECSDAQLALARQSESGATNLEFRKGRPQDLQLDLEQLDDWLQSHPARSSHDWLQAEAQAEHLRRSSPLIPSDSIDVVLGHRVLNLVPQADRPQTLAEIYRVLKRNGRVVIREIVSDDLVPVALQNDSTLWNNSVSGACREDVLLAALEAAGFHGIEIVTRHEEPHVTIAGIEFRGITVQAFKGKAGPCFERHQAVVYNGPWKAVIDDDGHTLYRGKRMAVCDKTFQIYSRAPYADAITLVPPVTEIPLAEARPFNCKVDAVRDPKETKATGPIAMPLLQISGECGPSGCC
ncbi:MAG: arsenite S-adenosylmethyltransferase [Planctomycetaceae bacterium]|nr:arsenite S-adenosylmethyltransferase [Planctomycetaceae bacterium]